MKFKKRKIALIFYDIVLFNIGIVLAYLLRFDGYVNNVFSKNIYNIILMAVTAAFIKIACSAYFKLYSSLWLHAGFYEMISIIKAAFISNSIMFCIVLFLDINTPKSIFLITFFIDTALLGGSRFSYRIIRDLIRERVPNDHDQKRVMIVGGGEAGTAVVRELILHPELKSYPIAIIDDDRGKIGKKISGIPIVGNRNSITDTAHKKQIDEIIISIPSADREVINGIYNECRKTHCKIKILPGISQLLDESALIYNLKEVDVEDLLERDPVRHDIQQIASFLDGKAVLVTGGGGSIGSELCRQLSNFKLRQLIILDNYENNAYEIQNELLYKYPGLNLITVIANIRDLQRLDEIFVEYCPDVVFHAAAHKHVPLMEMNPTEAIKNNIFGTYNLVKCSAKYNAKRFILISTDKAVNPISIMGATKRVAEMIIQAASQSSDTIFAAVRFGNVLGSNGSVIPLFQKQIEKGGPVTVTHPDVTRFFMTMQEAAQLVIEAGAMAKGGEIFVLDMGEPIKIYELAKTLIRLSGLEPDKDIKIVFTGLRPGEKMNEELMSVEENLQYTKNDKIYILPSAYIDAKKLTVDLEQLQSITLPNDEEAVRRLQRIVPEWGKG